MGAGGWTINCRHDYKPWHKQGLFVTHWTRVHELAGVSCFFWYTMVEDGDVPHGGRPTLPDDC